MAHFTQLDQAAIDSLSLDFSLGPVRAWKSIAAGTINSNYRLEASEGIFFLRVNEGKSPEEVKLEIAVLSHLVSQALPTPLPRCSKAGERFAMYQGKFISVFEWLPGSHVDSQTITGEHCAAAGGALAALHRAGQSMDLQGMGRGRYAHDKLLRLFAAFKDSTDPTLVPVCALLRDEIAWLGECESLREAAPRGLIHADLFPDNVLMDGTEVTALLDFEQACEGSLVYDLAVAVNAWCFAQSLVPERIAALLRGYQRVLTEVEYGTLEIELRASALRFTITRISDVYLPARAAGVRGGGSAATPTLGKDFRRFQMRLEHWRSLSAGEFLRIADLAQEAPPS